MRDLTRATETVTDLNTAYNLIGSGMRLRIPHGGGQCALVEGNPFPGGSNRVPVLVSEEMAHVMAESTQLRLAPRERRLDRLGWLELGYDGDVADWYSYWC